MNRKNLLLFCILFVSLNLSLACVSAVEENSTNKTNNATDTNKTHNAADTNKTNNVTTTNKSGSNIPSSGIYSSKVLGKNSNGYVKCIELGNRSSKVKIAYIIGIHPREYKPHKALYKQLLAKSKSGKLKYRYFIYNVTVTKNSFNFKVGRMSGQLLAKKYILPHAKKAGYNLVVDIHSTAGPAVGYKKKYFINAPLNEQKSKKIAKKLINSISGLSYYYPKVQTSPPYCTNPLVKSGTKTIVYETYKYESQSTTNKRIGTLINAVDKVFR